MKHRHLAHEDFTLAAIEDILDRGKMPDWVPLIAAIRADPYGEAREEDARCVFRRGVSSSARTLRASSP